MITTQKVASIRAALNAGDLQVARHHFDLATRGDSDGVTDLVKQLAAAVHIPKGAIVWGCGLDVWCNPYRFAYAWRCGDCPWTGSGYQSARRAQAAAERHAASHWADGEPVPAVLEYGETIRPRGETG